MRWNQCCHCLPPGGLWLYKQTGANRDPLPYRHPHGWLAEIRTRPSPGCVCNPRHYLPPPPCYHRAPPSRTTFCLPTIAFAPPHMATTMCIFFFFCYARSTLWTSRLFLPPVHNSNGQRPLLVLTGLEDLGFAHSAVTQLLAVFRGLCD